MFRLSAVISLLLVLPLGWADTAATSAEEVVVKALPITEESATAKPAYQAQAIRQGDFDLAENKLLGLLAEEPGNPYALLNLAFVYQRSGRAEQALILYNRVLELRKNPLAELSSGQPARVKRIAQRGIAVIEQ